MRQKLKLLMIIGGGISSLLLGISIDSSRPIKNYNNSDKPVFIGNYAQSPEASEGTIAIISWNSQYGEHLEKSSDWLAKADILLLQEMTEFGTEGLAKVMNLNHVYYPGSIHKHHDQNFGNAVLSKWPIINHHKIILSSSPSPWKHTRNAVAATILVEDRKIMAYSVHTDHLWQFQTPGNRQIDVLIKDISENSDTEFILVVGDFNTFSPKSNTYLDGNFNQHELENIVNDANPTFYSNPLQFRLDHVFARGFSAKEGYVMKERYTGDHSPLWAVVSLQE